MEPHFEAPKPVGNHPEQPVDKASVGPDPIQAAAQGAYHEDLLENQNRSRPKHGHPAEQEEGESKEPSMLDCAKLFGKAFAQSAFQEPLNGVIQLEANAVSDKDYALPQFDMIKELPEQETGSRGWVAQTLGSGFGSVLPFVGIELATKGAGGSAAWQALRRRADGAPVLASIMGADKASHYVSHLGKTTLDGTVYGATFVPASDPTTDFWEQRAKNVGAIALTFGTQNAVSHGILNGVERSGIGHMHFHDEKTLTVKSAAWHMGANMIGGSTAGVVGAESISYLYGQGPANIQNLESAAASFAVTGLALDVAHVGELKLAGRFGNKDDASQKHESGTNPEIKSDNNPDADGK